MARVYSSYAQFDPRKKPVLIHTVIWRSRGRTHLKNFRTKKQALAFAKGK